MTLQISKYNIIIYFIILKEFKNLIVKSLVFYISIKFYKYCLVLIFDTYTSFISILFSSFYAS